MQILLLINSDSPLLLHMPQYHSSPYQCKIVGSSEVLPFEEVNKILEAKLIGIVEVEAAALNPELPAILAGHLHVSGARWGSERSMMVSQEPVVLRSSIANPAFDYVALGHIHKPQLLSHLPPVVYSGSLQRIDFGEEEEEKGFHVLELDETRGRGQRVASLDFRGFKP